MRLVKNTLKNQLRAIFFLCCMNAPWECIIIIFPLILSIYCHVLIQPQINICISTCYAVNIYNVFTPMFQAILFHSLLPCLIKGSIQCFGPFCAKRSYTYRREYNLSWSMKAHMCTAPSFMNDWVTLTVVISVKGLVFISIVKMLC